MRNQESYRIEFENENRIKEDAKNKKKRITSLKNSLEECLQKLENSKSNLKATLEKKIKDKDKLFKEITEIENTSLKLKNDIAKISEKLDQADNRKIALQEKKKEIIKREIIEKLKQFSGVVLFLLSLQFK